MISTETVTIDGREFTHTYSDTYKIRKAGTEDVYDDALDVLPFEYEETDQPLDVPASTPEEMREALRILGVQGDANLVAGNSKSGVTIFGVEGTHEGGGGGTAVYPISTIAENGYLHAPGYGVPGDAVVFACNDNYTIYVENRTTHASIPTTLRVTGVRSFVMPESEVQIWSTK